MSDEPTRVPAHLCPFCQARLSAVAGFAEKPPPSPGDFVICLMCGAILRLDQDMHARKLDADALQLLANDSELARELGGHRQRILTFNATMKGRKHRDN